MDGVLATGPAGDTDYGERIYRTFGELPTQFGRIRAAAVPFHVVTAKVEADAAQVLEAVGLGTFIDSIVGANRLFWPSIWKAIREGRLPRSVVKSVYRTILTVPDTQRVVMIEDRRKHLSEMLAAGVIDFGVLVPPILRSEGRIVEWFDLNLALRVATDLAFGRLDSVGLADAGLTVCDGQGNEVEAGQVEVEWPNLDAGGYLLSLPRLPAANSGPQVQSLDNLDTGCVLRRGRPSTVTMVRAGVKMIRQTVGRLKESS